jgi:threonyl-tRNA synthetase
MGSAGSAISNGEATMLDEKDHREIGKRLDLFHFQEEAPGMVFWHPRGLTLLGVLEELIRRQFRRDGFSEVRTPQLLRLSVWETSGHLAHQGQHMFVLHSEAESCAVKPVSCPGHMELFRRRAASYRELPLRFAELGLVHRKEPSGTLHGLFRLRQFTQDDGHVFCSAQHVQAEIARFARSLLEVYRAFGFSDSKVAFSSRPDERAGSDESWDLAERLLLEAAREAGLDPEAAPKAGAFYGPKLEFALADRLGRSWQCGTIQLDLVLPDRFDIQYVASSGQRVRPMVLHRATLGSLERFLGILLEQHAAALPPWLAPEQAVVLPVGADDAFYAAGVVDRLVRAGLRARADSRDEPLSRRVLAAHEAGAIWTIVLGPRERAGAAVSLRRGAARETLPLDAAVDQLVRECQLPL